jgi:hypothetical protein
MRDATIILARFPGPVRLQLSFMRRFAGLAVSLGFLALFGYLLVEPRSDSDSWYTWHAIAMAWLGLAMSAAFSVRAVILLLAPGGARLTLDADGFVSSTVFWHVRTRWRDANDFRVVKTEARRLPVVRYDVTVPGETGRGAEETRDLPHDYSLDIHDLARLMNEWRRRALERAA